MKRRLVVTLDVEIEVDGRSTDATAGWAAARLALIGQPWKKRGPHLTAAMIKRVRPVGVPAKDRLQLAITRGR